MAGISREIFCARKAQPVLRFRRDEMDALHSCFHRARDRSDISHRLRLAGPDDDLAFDQPATDAGSRLRRSRRCAADGGVEPQHREVEMLPPVGGKEATKQSFKGGMVMIIITAESTPPRHLVRTLGDTNTPFVGSWTYEISPADTGSKVVLTEVAEFKNPLFRVMTRIFGQTKYMDEHLEDLAKKFGETATVM